MTRITTRMTRIIRDIRVLIRKFESLMITKNGVQHIASLARIGITGEELEKYQKDLSAILDYFRKLEGLDTDDIEPIGHITGRFNSYREDKREDFGDLGKVAIMKNVPEVQDKFVKVKSVL